MTVLRKAERKKKEQGSRPNGVPLADRLLKTLMYWPENHTYFHIAETNGIDDSAFWRSMSWIEDALVRSGAFGSARISVCEGEWGHPPLGDEL